MRIFCTMFDLKHLDIVAALFEINIQVRNIGITGECLKTMLNPTLHFMFIKYCTANHAEFLQYFSFKVHVRVYLL